MTTDTIEKGLESLSVRPMTDPGGLAVATSAVASGLVLFSQFG